MRLGGFPRFHRCQLREPNPRALDERSALDFSNRLRWQALNLRYNRRLRSRSLRPSRRITVSDEVLHLSINANQSEQLKAPTYSIIVAAGRSEAQSVGSLSVFLGINNLIKSNDR